MISYFLSGEIQIREEICSCDFCYDGNFISRDDQTTGPKERVHMLGDSSESNWEESDDSDVNEFFYDDDSEGDAQSDMEENELFSHTEFSNTIDVGKIIAIYSTETVNEPFFLFLKKGKQSNIFLMIMITTFLLVLIIWWSVILKKLWKLLIKNC